MGNDENILSMQALKNSYEVVAQNLKLACEKLTDNIIPVPTRLKEGDLVFIQTIQPKLFNLVMWAITELSPLKEIRLKFVKLKVETPLGYI